MHLFLTTPLGQELPSVPAENLVLSRDPLALARQLDALNRATGEDALEVAAGLVHSVLEDLKARSLSPAKCQVLVSCLPHRASALEDALREAGMRPVHAVAIEGQLTVVEPCNLRPNLRAQVRSVVTTAAPLEMDQLPPNCRAQVDAATTQLGNQTAEVAARQWAIAVSKALASAFEPTCPAHERRVVVTAPRWLTSLLESSLEKSGLQPLHRTEQGLVEGVNALSGEDIRGLNALRNALPGQGKGVTHDVLRQATSVTQRRRLGALDKAAQAAAAEGLAAEVLARLTPRKAAGPAPTPTPTVAAVPAEPPAPPQAPASPEVDTVPIRPPADEPRSAQPVPASTEDEPAEPPRSNVPRPREPREPRSPAPAMHPLVKYLRSRRFPVELDALAAALGQELLDKAQEQLNASLTDKAAQWLNERSQAKRVPKPDALDALFAWAHAQLTDVSDTVSLTSHGIALGTLGELRGYLATVSD